MATRRPVHTRRNGSLPIAPSKTRVAGSNRAFRPLLYLPLDAAGFPPEFDEPSLDEGLPPQVTQVIERMLAQHEPLPLVIMNRCYDVLKANRGAMRLIARFVADQAALNGPLNVIRVLLDPRLARPFLVDWERVARLMMSRLHLEALARPADETLAAFVRQMHEYPEVQGSWRQPDFSTSCEPGLVIRAKREDLEVAFLTTTTTFSAPQNVTLGEIRIDSYFPLDEKTAQTCAFLARQDLPRPLRRLVEGGVGYRERSEFAKSSKRMTIRSEPTILPGRISISGCLFTEPGGPGRCRRVYESTVTAALLGIGGAVEDVINRTIRESYDRAADFTNRWAAEHQGR